MEITENEISLTQRRGHLQQVCQVLQEIVQQQNFIRAQEALAVLRDNIENDIYTVVVLGEFKRGKTTFVNALLGTPLLPMDVLPETALIHAIMYEDEPRLEIVYKDGRHQKGELTAAFLEKYSAKEADEKDLASIAYLKIGYPLGFLKNHVVLVDTPGVSDLNAQRCEVTYSFLPRADAVIFLLDATSPLKRTEKEFIEDHLFRAGIKNVLFILNKYDQIDDEEDEDLLEETKQRLHRVFTLDETSPIDLLPLSAKVALTAKQTGQTKLLELSGVSTIENHLQQTMFSGSMEEQKIIAWETRCHRIRTLVEREISQSIALKEADVSALETTMKAIHEEIARHAENKIQIQTYVTAAKKQIVAMIDKSLRHFQRQLQEEITYSIERYQAEDFKDFVERDITRRIRRNIEAWVKQYEPYIQLLLKKIEAELAQGLSLTFQRKIQLASKQSQNPNFGEVIGQMTVQAEDLTMTNIHAGAILAVGGAGLMLATGGLLMPFLSLAAFPFLRRKMLKDRLEIAKEQVLPQLESGLEKFIISLQGELHQYVDKNAKVIQNNTAYAFDKILADFQTNLQKVIDEKRSASDHTIVEIQELRCLQKQMQRM